MCGNSWYISSGCVEGVLSLIHWLAYRQNGLMHNGRRGPKGGAACTKGGQMLVGVARERVGEGRRTSSHPLLAQKRWEGAQTGGRHRRGEGMRKEGGSRREERIMVPFLNWNFKAH